MIVAHIKDLPGIKLEGAQLQNVVKKVLISPENGWEGNVMRVFELGEGGYTPKHTHPWPHINYILKGKGSLHLDNQDYPLEAGSFAYVPAEKIHQFKNVGNEPFSFICIVPEEGDK